MLKSAFIVSILLTLAVPSFAAPIMTVSKKQFGEKWAFTREELMLECRKEGSLWVINPSTLMQYPLNNLDKQRSPSRKGSIVPIKTILLDNPQKPGEKMSVEPFKIMAKTLCQ